MIRPICANRRQKGRGKHYDPHVLADLAWACLPGVATAVAVAIALEPCLTIFGHVLTLLKVSVVFTT